MSQPALKHEVNERLAAYRSRRGGAAEQPQTNPVEAAQAATAKEAQIKARVKARFANAPSYNDLVSGESTPVGRVAEAVAKAAVEAVMAEMGQAAMTPTLWDAPVPQYVQAAPAASVTPSRWEQDEPEMVQAAAPQPTRWEDAVPPPVARVEAEEDVWASMRVYPAPYEQPQRVVEQRRNTRAGLQESELFAFDPMDPTAVEDPMHGAMVEPAQAIQANVIEFPRELVAPRKARPRLAEGPYRRAEEDSSQLSLFEVEPEAMSAPEPVAQAAIAPPEWATIELEAHPLVADEPRYAEPVYEAYTEYEPQVGYEPDLSAMPVEGASTASAASQSWDEYTLRETYAPKVAEKATAERVRAEGEAASAVELLVAPVSDRAMAALVDMSVVALATVVASFAAVACMSQVPSGKIALIAAAVGYLLIGVAYQYIFLSFAEEGTVGMRYARIALCTFEDDNPTREQMRMRIPAMLLAAVPAGLGLAWAVVDREHVGWHDRLTRTYQRKY